MFPQYLAGVLNYSHSGGIEPNVQSVEDIDHELPHGLKLMWPNAAGAVDKEDQIHRSRLTFLVMTWKKEEKQITRGFIGDSPAMLQKAHL